MVCEMRRKLSNESILANRLVMPPELVALNELTFKETMEGMDQPMESGLWSRLGCDQTIIFTSGGC